MAIDQTNSAAHADVQPFAQGADQAPTGPITIPRESPTSALAKGLGLFGVGLGLIECLAPQRLSRLIGVQASPTVVRLLGVREITAGIGILLGRTPAPWLWARVGGDLMALALLAAAKKTDADRVTAAIGATVAITALDALCSEQMNAPAAEKMLHIKQSISVNRTPEDLYALWRDLAQLPQYLPHLESVEPTSENESHWVAQGPAGSHITWDATISRDEPNYIIAWQTLKGSSVAHAGTVWFERAPEGHGTIIHVDLHYMPPAGLLGAEVAQLTGRAPEQEIHKDLHHFKQIIETGEVPRTEGQPAGRRSSLSALFDIIPRL